MYTINIYTIDSHAHTTISNAANKVHEVKVYCTNCE